MSQSEKLPIADSNIAMRPGGYGGLAEREGFVPHPQDLTNTNIGFCGRIQPRDAVHGRDKPRTASRSNFYGGVTFGVT